MVGWTYAWQALSQLIRSHVANIRLLCKSCRWTNVKLDTIIYFLHMVACTRTRQKLHKWNFPLCWKPLFRRIEGRRRNKGNVTHVILVASSPQHRTCERGKRSESITEIITQNDSWVAGGEIEASRHADKIQMCTHRNSTCQQNHYLTQSSIDSWKRRKTKPVLL